MRYNSLVIIGVCVCVSVCGGCDCWKGVDDDTTINTIPSLVKANASVESLNFYQIPTHADKKIHLTFNAASSFFFV